MTFRLADKGWDSEFIDGLRREPDEVRIVCPFIKARALAQILTPRPASLHVITRFNLADFAVGVSDIEALRLLLDAAGAVRSIRGLHAKLYIFGSSRAIVTSANLIGAGLSANREFGIVTEDRAAVDRCLAYFKKLWRFAGPDLARRQLDRWDLTLADHLASGGRPAPPGGLGDFGAEAGIELPPNFGLPPIFSDPPQAIVKFGGESTDRAPLDCPIIEAIERGGSHWALAYWTRRNSRARCHPGLLRANCTGMWSAGPGPIVCPWLARRCGSCGGSREASRITSSKRRKAASHRPLRSSFSSDCAHQTPQWRLRRA